MQRVLVRLGAVVASFLVLALPLTSLAAPSPASGTITEANPAIPYNGGPLVISPGATANNACPADATAESFALTVDLPPDFDVRRPDDRLRFDLGPIDSADMVLTIRNAAGEELDSADGGATSGREIIMLDAEPGIKEYRVLVCVFAGTAPSYHVDLTLTVAIPNAGGIGYAPRFQALASPPALGNSAGEPSIGYNTTSHRAMFQASLQTLRVTFPEYREDDPLNPTGLPEACDALWEDVSFPTTSVVSLDPIGFTDFTTGRWFSGQLGTKQHNMAYTDDDGANWTPSAGNFPGAAGVDHQTIGWGPYVAGGNAGPLTDYPNAVYYCSQDIAYANCSRSDDGGTTFLPPVPAYTVSTCGGLHGHIRAAPDGTVYLPNKSCGGQQAVAVSEDNGLNWEVRKVPTSTSGSTDPQMALASDGTGYFCYTASDGRPRVAVTHDKGKTWSNDTNLGAQVGVVTAVFAQGIAGDPDRAACGFIGTTTPGNSGAEDFPGIWHAYIAVTYDGGASWSTTNVTPDDPVQGAGGVCTNGTTCGDNRNLLDFNEITLDEKGRPIMGFADGCVGTCVTNPSGINRSDKAAIARAIGGKSLYAALDQPEPHAPQAACLAGTRTTDSVELAWRPPADDGKSPVTAYRIYRGTTQANQSLLITVSPKVGYSDFSADPNEPEYFYKIVAVNAQGDSVFSNLIQLPIDTSALLETSCVAPGLTMLEDAEGDSLNELPPHDVRRLSISQPEVAEDDYLIYFHLKMSDLSVVPANTYWPVNFCSPAFPCVDPGRAVDVGASPYGADNKYYTVRMSTVAPASPTAPAFEILQPTAAGDTAGSRTVKALPAGQAGFEANGLITMGVRASDLGLSPSGAGVDRLSKFQVRIQVNGIAISQTPDNMPDSLSGAGEYLTTGLRFCAVNTPPQASLAVSTQQGPAPLTVDFDASGSFDADSQDTIVQYIFDFGDGTENTAQASPTTRHTYATTGFYNATVRVRDSRGLASGTAAAKVIEVTEGKAASDLGSARLGGTLSPLTLGLLALIGLRSRRRQIRRH